jgi:hypothetical protein
MWADVLATDSFVAAYRTAGFDQRFCFRHDIQGLQSLPRNYMLKEYIYAEDTCNHHRGRVDRDSGEFNWSIALEDAQANVESRA